MSVFMYSCIKMNVCMHDTCMYVIFKATASYRVRTSSKAR